MIALMFAFNSFSHGTQDVYPTFLQKNLKFDPKTVSLIAIVYNLGALSGGILFGTLSEKIGRRRAIVIAALLTIPIIPLWAYSKTVPLLALGGFLMQFMVQGAWGVIPGAPQRIVSARGSRHTCQDSPISLETCFPRATATIKPRSWKAGTAEIILPSWLDGATGGESGCAGYNSRPRAPRRRSLAN